MKIILHFIYHLLIIIKELLIRLNFIKLIMLLFILKSHIFKYDSIVDGLKIKKA